MCHFVRFQARRIVAAHFIDTRSQRCGTIELADNHVRIGGKASLEVRPYRRDENHEEVFVGRMHAHLGSRTDKQRTDVQRGPALVWRDKTLVEPYHLLDHFFKTFRRQFGHQYAAARALQTLGILVHAEHAHLAVRTTVSLQPLESFLPVVQASSRHVDIEGLLRTNFNLSPLSVTIIATYVIVCLHIAERQVRPIDFFHLFRF